MEEFFHIFLLKETTQSKKWTFYGKRMMQKDDIFIP